MVSFTGSVSVGKHIARSAGYKKLVLELGGMILIILEDADLDQAVHLACEGAFRNSGQRGTAVKRIMVQRSILEKFTQAMVERAKSYTAGDPSSMETRIGTVIDEASAIHLEETIKKAVSDGARVLLGGGRQGTAGAHGDCRYHET